MLHTVSFFVALAIVVILHVLLGEMVPKNIAIAGPEAAAMLLVPAYLVYIRAARPFIAFYNWCANATLRAFRVEPKDELESAVSTVELSEMIAESVSEGLLDTEEHGRLTRALETRSRLVRDVALPLSEIHAIRVAAPGSGPTVGDVERALTDTGYSRFPVTDAFGEFIGYLHIKDVLPHINDPDAVLDLSMVRPLPLIPATMPLPDALSRMRRSNSHLALVVSREEHAHGGRDGTGDGPDELSSGTVTAMVALEDLVEDLVGTVRDGTHRI